MESEASLTEQIQNLRDQATYLRRWLTAVSLRPELDDDVKALVIEAIAEVQGVLHCIDNRTPLDGRVHVSTVEHAAHVESQRLQAIVRSTLASPADTNR